MIKITDKSKCCGCSACAQRCPKQCIKMQQDAEGFFYPKVDASVCIDCHLCERVCPVINQGAERKPLEVFAAKCSNDDIRTQSSSGGLFTLLAEQTIEQGGVVFGARWDEEWNVRHDYTETKEGIVKLRSSKYLQSVIGDSYLKAEKFLKEGRKVMFTGTPCQIAGLKHFLRKDYDNLLAVEVICHSVPSPGVWQRYLSEKLHSLSWKKADISHITFRDKRTGWKGYSFAIENKKGEGYTELGSKNAFMRGFLADLYTRPSCHACPAKQLKSGSDITLGDFWGIESLMPEIDDNHGVSAVLANTDRGRKALNDLQMRMYPLSYEELIKRNPALIRSVAEPKNRAEFFKDNGRMFEEKIRFLIRNKYTWRIVLRVIARNLLSKKARKRIRLIMKM